MAKWKGGFDRSFSKDEFDDYVKSLRWTGWRPQFVCIHNTGAPNLKQWKATPGGEAQRLKNLAHYYQNQQGWSSGPHLFIGERIWLGSPLTGPGTHSPSFNAISIGVEIAGDYDHDKFEDPIRENTIVALAELHEALGLDPGTMRLHREDPRTTHDCPGKGINKAALIEAVRRAMIREGEHATEDETVVAPVEKPKTHVVKAGDTLWGIGKRYGVAVDALIGWNGADPLKIGETLWLAAPEAPKPVQTAAAAEASPKAAKFAAREEACVLVPYMDGDVPAIGFGHRDPSLKIGGPAITIEEAFRLKREDMKKHAARVLKAVKVPLAQHELDALTLFDMNTGAINKASLTAKLNAGDRQGAADGLLKWNKDQDAAGNLVVKPGLTRRREAERMMFLKGEYGDISTFPLYTGNPKTTKPVRTPFPT